MTECDEILATLFLGGVLDADAAAHLSACPRCATEQVHVRRVAELLASHDVPPPASTLSARVLGAAAPLLARHARRAAWRTLARALAAALVPLPLIVFLDFYLVRAAYGVLDAVLPRALSLYVVFNYAATLTLLLALTYGMIPIVAERQMRLRREESRA